MCVSAEVRQAFERGQGNGGPFRSLSRLLLLPFKRSNSPPSRLSLRVPDLSAAPIGRMKRCPSLLLMVTVAAAVASVALAISKWLVSRTVK